MSRVLLLVLVVLALFANVATATQGEFESELAAEVPDLIEHQPGEFMTLDDLAIDAEPEESFAELDEEAHDQAESEDAAEAEESEEPAMLETESESDAAPKPWHRSDANQPVARNKAEITCLDGDCTRATKVRKAAVGTHPNAKTKKPPTKLDIALGAVKEEIMVRAKELHLEKAWSGKVATLIDDYQQKLNKVSGNIIALRAQVKALLRKKKQIQNVQVQNKLRYKLKLAQSDLNRLQKQMEHIAGKENEFSDTEKQLKGTMNALKNSLLKLRGQETKKLAAEGIEL
jgi:hypothetical protein